MPGLAQDKQGLNHKSGQCHEYRIIPCAAAFIFRKTNSSHPRKALLQSKESIGVSGFAAQEDCLHPNTMPAPQGQNGAFLLNKRLISIFPMAEQARGTPWLLVSHRVRSRRSNFCHSQCCWKSHLGSAILPEQPWIPAETAESAQQSRRG